MQRLYKICEQHTEDSVVALQSLHLILECRDVGLSLLNTTLQRFYCRLGCPRLKYDGISISGAKRGWAIWLGHVCGPCECGPCVGGPFGWVMFVGHVSGPFGWVMLVGHVSVDHAWVGHLVGSCLWTMWVWTMRGWAIWLGHACGPCYCGPCVGRPCGWAMHVAWMCAGGQ